MSGACTEHPGRENHCVSGACGSCWLCRETLIRQLRARLTSAEVQENESLRSRLAVSDGALRYLETHCQRLVRERNDLRGQLDRLVDEWEVDRFGNDSRAFRARLACAEDLRAALASEPDPATQRDAAPSAQTPSAPSVEP